MKPTKTVIITGTSRGIGFELVHLFAHAGYAVLALSRNAKPVSNLNFENIHHCARTNPSDSRLGELGLENQFPCNHYNRLNHDEKKTRANPRRA